jgi:hypothetical protein
MLEIIALCDLAVIVRCAAVCKLLRHGILSSSFIRWAAPRILAYLRSNGDEPFALVHPATPAAASLCYDHLFPFFLRRAAGLFGEYNVETSRRGLLLLHRMNITSLINNVLTTF